ncbi:putative uncharacterized protein C7orf78 homolog [Haliaeetus albicilla]|uniref:putative uncharacterized protein C7orf78 homolog n=1 Tax=Haliaeetus albicilla TaxID=8969 RepID=UPI0037E985C8
MYFPFQVQYEDNLPNLVTSYSRDPLNLKLKSQHLNIGKALTTCTFIVLKKLGITGLSGLSGRLKTMFFTKFQYQRQLLPRSKKSDRRFLTYRPCESKWDPQMLLPKNPWPPKSASFTRHRRQHGAHTVFLDHVDENLCQLQQGEAGRDESVHSAREPQPKQHGVKEKAV